MSGAGGHSEESTAFLGGAYLSSAFGPTPIDPAAEQPPVHRSVCVEQLPFGYRQQADIASIVELVKDREDKVQALTLELEGEAQALNVGVVFLGHGRARIQDASLWRWVGGVGRCYPQKPHDHPQTVCLEPWRSLRCGCFVNNVSLCGCSNPVLEISFSKKTRRVIA